MSSVIRSLVVKVGADTKQFQSKMKNISKDLGKAGKNISQVGKKLTMGVTLPVVAAGAAAFKMAADMEDAMGAADQIFGKSAENMKGWAKGLESYYGIASAEAMEYGNMMGSMLQNIGGLTESEAAKQSQTLIKLAGDLTAMYGGTTQDAVRALTGALKGNNTMLDNYGMAVNDSMIKTKALEMGLYDGTGAMDLATKQAATLALIMEQSGAAQGQAAREAEGASGSMRALMTEVKNLGTSIGTVLLPIVTPLIAKIKEMVEKFGGLDEKTKKLIVTVAMFAAAAGPILSILGGTITSVSKVIGVVGKFSRAVSGGSKIVKAFGVLLGPGGVVLLAVAAFAAGAYLVYKNWGKIKDFFSGLKTSILGFFSDIKSAWDNWNPKEKVFNALTAAGEDGTQSTYKFSPKVVNSGDFKKMATGGIVTKPTYALVGEAGPEAVIPLDKMQGGSNIVINVTGNTIASDYDVEKIGTKLAGIISRENRRIPNRASLIPIG